MIGAKFSEEGKPVTEDKNVVFTTEHDQLKVNMVANPKHLYLFNPLPTMNNLTAGSTNQLVSEDLIPPFKHNMPFRPAVWLYMSVIDAPAAGNTFIGTYTTDFYRLGPTLIYAYADDTYVYIKHDYYYTYPPLPAPPVDPITETGADEYKIRAKLLVLNSRYVGQIRRAAP